MTQDPSESLTPDWPLFGVRLRCHEVALRPMREADLPHLAAIQPDDYEHDPRAELLDGLDESAHRRRLTYQDYWRSLGTWSPASWSLTFAVEHHGAVVGVQSLEAEHFLAVRTVDSGSWLTRSARGHGIAVRMRTAVLGLAFDHLGAHLAVTSARRDNDASLAVSSRVGYQDNGISLNASRSGLTELQHMRLTRAEWRSSGRGASVIVSGLEPCLPWFGLGRSTSPT